MASLADLDGRNVVDIDLGSAEFKANAHRHMAEWARRPPFYVLGQGQPQVVVGRYADVHKVFSDTQTFASEMPRGPGWLLINTTPLELDSKDPALREVLEFQDPGKYFLHVQQLVLLGVAFAVLALFFISGEAYRGVQRWRELRKKS